MPTWEEHKLGAPQSPGKYSYVSPADANYFQPDEIESMVPVPLAFFRLGREFTEVEKLAFDHLLGNGSRANGSNALSADTYIFNKPELLDIANFCHESLRSVLRYAYGASQDADIQITQSWLTYAKLGGSHHMHNHPNSVLSGILYVNTGDGDGTNFVKISNGDVVLRYKTIERTKFNVDSERAEATPGTLVIFPSYVWHVVYNSKTEGRMSLAFNSFINGSIGDVGKIHELNI
jgi:hypothetical protein